MLAHRLSTLPRAPAKLSRKLATDDDIEVAGPILQKSDRLDTATLVETASTKTQQHLLAISRRSSLDERITDVLVERGDKPVVLSTANNPGARFSDAGFNTLVTRSKGDDELAASVGLRRDIPRQHLMRLLVQASHAVRTKLETANPAIAAADLPPLKWSSLKYYFDRGGYGDGQEEAYGGRDRCQASAG